MIDNSRIAWLIPAYGRRYLSYRGLVADWEKGMDFKFRGGPYVSVRDTAELRQDGVLEVHIFLSALDDEFATITL